MAQDDKVVDKAVYKLQLAFLEGMHNENQFFAAASLISKSDYEHVVTERSISNLCGYPPCTNTLPLPSERTWKGNYHIYKRREYNLHEIYLYCSARCNLNNQAFAASLQDKSTNTTLPLPSERPWKGHYHISSKDHIWYDLHEIYKRCYSRCNLNSEAFAASLHNLDLKEEDKVVLGLSSKLQIHEKVEEDPKKTTVGDDLIGPSNAIEGYVPLRDRIPFPPKVLPLKMKKNHQQPKMHKFEEEEAKFQESKADQFSILQEMGDTIAESSSSSNVEEDVDSSLRCFASAEEEEEACMDAFRQAADSFASGELVDVMDAVYEAGTSILPQPQFIDGGDSRKDESGTNIFPQPQNIEGKDSQEDEDELEEPERLPLKWPMKTGTLDFELFDSENSWYDTPPEGFSLSLSPFATMWMSLFGWITSSSLAYIYGSEESSEEEFVLVNGREYPRKIVVGGGRSSEIMNTLSGCLTRSLPELVSDLRISIPISVLDKGMGRLLDTTTFTDALPPFRMKQWHVIILLFLDALSVCRIPGLTPYMTSSRMLQHKVLDGAQISVEEYGVMKDLLIPLGRAPLCGG